MRISALQLLSATEKSDEDYLPIVDASVGVTKRITIATLLSGVIAGLKNVQIQVGAITANNIGTPVTFDAAFAFADADYAFIPFGVKDGGNIAVSIGTVALGTRSVTGITVYPAVDGTKVYYIAIGA